MRKNITYTIDQFKWDAGNKTFYADGHYLFCDDQDYSHPFPNGKGQFYIINHNTGNHKRFRFLKEETWESEFESCRVWTFHNEEDGLYCQIYID